MAELWYGAVEGEGGRFFGASMAAIGWGARESGYAMADAGSSRVSRRCAII